MHCWRNDFCFRRDLWKAHIKFKTIAGVYANSSRNNDAFKNVQNEIEKFSKKMAEDQEC